MRRSILSRVVGAAACLVSMSAVAHAAPGAVPKSLRGCWEGHIGEAPALIEWRAPQGADVRWRGFATVRPVAQAPVLERHSLSPPQAGVVNLGWRYCHPEREGRHAADRCYWMRGPSGDLEDHVTFEVKDSALQIDSHAFGRTETLFRGVRAQCPAAPG